MTNDHSKSKTEHDSLLPTNGSVNVNIVNYDENSPSDEYLEHGRASIMNEIFNLIKNIVGSGVLALPSGVAAISASPKALIPTMILIIVTGLINAYYFSLIGRICALTDSRTYSEAWVNSVGKRGSRISSWGSTAVALTCIGKTVLGDLAYSMILADATKSLLITVGYKSATRGQALLGVAVCVLLPLCMVENLSSLAPFSILGLVGTIATAVAMAIRYFDGTYDVSEDGKFIESLPLDLRPSFDSSDPVNFFSPNSSILICMLATAYVAHYNAPKFYFELKDRTVHRYNIVVNSSYITSAILYIIITSLGFLTFGGNCDGLILNNYSTDDNLATLSRIGISVSVIFTYPLLFVGVRDGVLDLWNVSLEDRSTAVLRKLSLVIFTCITAMAWVCTDLTFVLAFGGATFATLVIYVFPTLMYHDAVRNLEKSTFLQKGEVFLAVLLMLLGIAVGLNGAVLSFQGVSA